MTTETIEVYDNGKLEKIECEQDSIVCIDSLLKCYNLSLNVYDNNYKNVFDYILSQVVHLTKSEIGGVLEKVSIDGEEHLRFFTVSDKDCGTTSHIINNDTIFGYSIIRNVIVISNNLSTDPRVKGLPSDHFRVDRFLAIPLTINDNSIGQIVLANKSTDYTKEDVVTIYPLIKVCTDTIFSIHYRKKYTLADMLTVKSDVKKVKDNFLATMSHEIRTPLTGIMGAVTLLPQIGSLNKKQQDHLKIATTCSVQLLDLINGILDFSRLTSNTLTLVKEPFNIKECIDNSVEIVKSKVDAKNLKLEVVFSKLPISVVGDSKRLKQVLVNLLSNAIKFTDRGSIVFSVTASKKSTDDLCWRISFDIQDTGIGIADQDQSKLFGIFSQVTGQNAYNKRDGVGLGLAISKELVELMGGKIKVSSDGAGKGSTFSFYIDIEENINIQDLLHKHQNIIEDINILSVDDKMENLLILEEMLFRWNLNSIMCNNAEQALRYLEHGKKFDLAIIDIYMPYMSGIELAQHLREIYPHLPLIGISSVENEDQGEKWFDVYLTKPYDQSKILKSIIYCLTRNTETSHVFPAKTISKREKSKDTLKILLAEDDHSTQFMIKEMIINLGYAEYNITTVDNGKSCVDTVKNNHYDVCLMDIKMPVMDGLEASRHIRQLLNRPYLIAISAGVLDTDKNSCLAAGMDGYLAKPFSITELDTVLKIFIE